VYFSLLQLVFSFKSLPDGAKAQKISPQLLITRYKPY